MSEDLETKYGFFLVNEEVFQERVRASALEWIDTRISELYGIENPDLLTESQRSEIEAFLAREEQLCPYLRWALEEVLNLY
jgi:hypothetical protein